MCGYLALYSSPALITIDGMGSDDELIANAQGTFGTGLRAQVEPAGGGFTAHLVHDDGTIAWPDFAAGPDRLLALLAAEQRYLVEERGSGSVSGRTYEDKASERLRRWRMEPILSQRIVRSAATS
jgi:hypothetical protein